MIVKGVYIQLITTLGWQLSMEITEQQENVHKTINKDIKTLKTKGNFASNANFLPTTDETFFLFLKKKPEKEPQKTQLLNVCQISS